MSPAVDRAGDTDAYLARLGLVVRPEPTLDTLRELHRRHTATIPYENLHTMLGSPPPVDRHLTLARVARGGNAGYCLHQNGLLEEVLTELGYDVVRLWGHNWEDEAERADVHLGHLVVYVRGLPTSDNPGGAWWPDLGFGDGIRDPLPLVTGEHRQGPFGYRLLVHEGGWTFHHDPQGSFHAVDVFASTPGDGELREAHARLSGPGGDYSRLLVVQRRLADCTETLRGCLFTRVGAGAERTELTAYDAWRVRLVELGASLVDVDEDALRALFDRSLVAHREWVTSR